MCAHTCVCVRHICPVEAPKQKWTQPEASEGWRWSEVVGDRWKNEQEHQLG